MASGLKGILKRQKHQLQVTGKHTFTHTFWNLQSVETD